MSMKKITLLLLLPLIGWGMTLQAEGIDMQAHVASDEGREAYTEYQTRQSSYYNGSYSYVNMIAQSGNTLFGTLNTLMGNTCKVGGSSYSYNSLRDEYVNVDRDLNKAGNIIGYYDGCTMNGTWDSGTTYNREHTWPQSKGADKNTPMGHDMQSVRPTSVKVNSDRGNDAYGESSGYYDPNGVKISNSNYKAENNGTYRGDCARVVLYDYLVYGEAGGHKNGLYNGNAQLLQKTGKSGVFETIEILLKWHMQDPPSLTEMVRNDGAQDYQGNRNPFIDYPELAIQVLQSSVQTYTISSNQTMTPDYRLTTKHGFVTYLTNDLGEHPETVTVTGASYTYAPETGRLTISNVTRAVSIATSMPTPSGVEKATAGSLRWYAQDGRLTVSAPEGGAVSVYSLSGMLMGRQEGAGEYVFDLPRGLYVLTQGGQTEKVMIW